MTDKSKREAAKEPLPGDIAEKPGDWSKLILDSSPLAFTVLDHNRKMIDCNDAAMKLFEISDKEEFLESPFLFSEPIQPGGMFAGELAREFVDKTIETGECLAEWTYRSKSYTLIPCEVTMKKIYIGDAFIILMYIRDLRAEIEAHAEIREVTERNEIMINVTPICFVFFDDELNVVNCNPAALSLFEVATPEEFADSFFSLSPEHQKDGKLSADSYKEKMQRAFNSGRLTFEWEHLTASGQKLPVEVTFVRVEYKGSYRLAGYFVDLRGQKAVLAEMRRAERKLRDAKELAEDSTRVKSAFLANMSHEIRTPMNGIIGITNLALEKETSDAQRDYLSKIDQSAKSLLRIINDILDFSKIEANRLELEKTEFRIDTVINEVGGITAFSVMQKGIGFNIDISDKIDFNVIGDSLRLQQVLLNMTSNAVKFTHKGSITISADVSERNGNTAELLFSVRDTGIGMSTKQTAEIFKAFGQADSSTTRKYGGTGLGLTICKSLVELMDGKIWLESAPGAGSTFFFTARFETVEARELETDNDTDGAGVDVPEEFKDARILLVEDNEINSIIALELLRAAGFIVDPAVNGAIAVDMFQKNDYELILMDIQMPETDGFTATRIIRSLKEYRQIPIVAMTANAMQGDKEKSLEAGMNDHITKPLVPKELMETVCRWIGESRGS